MAQATVGPADLDVIDLGEIGWRTPEDGGLRPERGGWRGRTLPPRAWRGLSAALIVAAVLASGVAAGTPGPALGRPLWTGRAERGFGIGALTVYIPDSTGVTAVSTRTGRVRWQVPGRDLDYAMETLGGLVVLGGLADTGVGEQEAVIVNGANGQVLMRHLGFGLGGIDERHVLLYEFRPGCNEAEPVPPCQTLISVNVGNGREEWRLSVPGDVWAIDTDPDSNAVRRLLLAGENGRATIHDADSGRVIATLPIDLTPTAVGGERRPQLMFFFTREGVLTAEAVGGGIRISLFRAGAAESIWSTRIDGPTLAADDYFYVSAVGDAVAVFYNARTYVLDPASGRSRFGLPASSLVDVGGGRLLAEAFDPHQPPALLDARTGDRLVAFPGTQVIYFHGTKGRALLSRTGPESSLIELVDLQGKVLLRDGVHGADVACRAREDVLVCADGSRALRVWQLADWPTPNG